MDLNQWLFKGGYSPRKNGIDKKEITVTSKGMGNFQCGFQQNDALDIFCQHTKQ